ncbi:ABC-F family ATP-binding cassette domain-containing protein [Blautia pseudococcoides]|uniref:ABC-F family ATP-binding cassette domain-containing protein n=1 Tax=Blautia pseudococcoides TaxID=1796616 RepID=UPI00148AE673|nr:ABC-F family ATP-binding cassette domain-containing protein [Blautia pseudococcoides]QJU13730.1 ABC-F family ATP-binding cassette domain-containing protein [Blautia pseudococcoides]
MNILNIEHISKIYGDKIIFEDASFGIHEGDKIGIIGINGTGKTTLLRMAAGIEEPDSGQIVRQNGLRIAYLPQNPEFTRDATVSSYALGKSVETDWMVESNLTKLGIVQYDTPLAQLSGGQRRKVAMAKVLASDFDVLLLDEPTNHLDEEMITWLEEYLREYKGVILMVTHDRYFLDKVSNRILEISRGNMYSYDANYSRFLELKAEREEMELASERKRQSVLRMELEWAKRGCRARSTKQRARLERLEALKNGKAPVQDQAVEMDSVETRMGKKTIELHHVGKSYGGTKLVDDFDYIVLRNQRLGIIGPNGCGKSTLIKMIAGLIQPDSGEIEIGETIKIGYLAQEEPDMDTDRRVIDYIRDIAEYVQTRDGKISASQMLERFLFTPDMQYTPVCKLSGGEKRRLYLLSVLISGANVYILDEPSNNVDIPTLTILEDYLNSFSGIVITVSHDRYFLDNVVDRIFEFDGNGHLQQYEGGYTDYLEAKERRLSVGDSSSSLKKQVPEKKEAAKDWKQNRPAKLKFTFKEQREYDTIDDNIAALEEIIEKLDGDMMANATNSLKLSELTAEKEKAEAELEEKMERWVYLNDLAEKIEEQKNA